MERDYSLGKVFSTGRKLFSSIARSPLFLSIANDLGYPAGLVQLIRSRPGLKAFVEEPSPSVAVESVANWHEWGHPSGELKGWKKQADFYGGTSICRDEFTRLGTRTITDNWACNIWEVDGLSSSKSDLTEYQDLDTFVEATSPKYIDSLSLDRLQDNLSHGEIRILKEDTSDHFAYHDWDGRLFLINSGGSHHFAAARYIAWRIEEFVPLQGQLYRYGINTDAIMSLRRDFDMFVIGESDGFNLDFNEAMRSYRADYYYANLPKPYTDLQAVFLPREKERSAKVATLLESEGFFDLGQYLQDLSFKGASGRFIN